MSDDPREYDLDEQRAISAAVHSVTLAVRRGEYADRAPGRDLLCELNRAVLGGVRPQGAGRIRDAGSGEERLTYGPNRSPDRSEVPSALAKVFGHAANVEPSLADPEDIVRFAVWLHAEVIRIHPFFDGNGRTSRLLCNIVLQRRLGAPVAIEVVRQEYLDAANAYYRATPTPNLGWKSAALDGLVDVFVECLDSQSRDR